jgi:phenylalanyl-tRNA synthetase beta chain
MNIQILDSWLREHLKTKASSKEIAEKLSLSSVSVEKLEKKGDDYLYDIEITTNRPDLMSVVGLAREAAAVLSYNKIPAEFIKPSLKLPEQTESTDNVNIKNNPELVNRICAVVMDVEIKNSPKKIQERLESAGIRSLNNLIDITNYVMRTIGHPTHVFDFDRIPTKTIQIRKSHAKEKIETLDGKEYELTGEDIVADDGLGHVIDLLGVMGLQNSVVTDTTKRILFFVNNNDPHRVRRTSMNLGIRTEAAVINEKGVDPELAMDALLYGIKLYEELANGKVMSEIVDIYPNKVERDTIEVFENKINSTIGVNIPIKTSKEILESLGFEVVGKEQGLTATPPSFRAQDMHIQEDVIEEVARIYGYHNIPNKLPSITSARPFNLETNILYYEDRIREALKYWGLTEVYTYPMVSEDLYEGDLKNAVTIQNPLNEEYVYMRASLVPSLLKVVKENKNHDKISIFEIGNIYVGQKGNLPKEILRLAGVFKSADASFFKVKGLIEQLLADLGITDVGFEQSHESAEITVNVGKDYVGDIEILDSDVINFELDLEIILKHATLKKTYKPLSKFPPIMEDLAIIAPADVTTGDLIATIKKQSSLVKDVSLLDKYEDTRTFHIVYQSNERNLKNEEIGEIREKILKELREKHKAKIKE